MTPRHGILTLPTPHPLARWTMRTGAGPVLATAVHAGHHVREELRPYFNFDEGGRRREEDPATDRFTAVADHAFVCWNSRFEVDLNRSRELALATEPERTWGLPIWKETPPDEVVAQSLAQHDRFYEIARCWLEQLIATHGALLLLDIHAYNHRRDGAEEPPANSEGNPDIDLGLTTLDAARFGGVAEALMAGLRQAPMAGRDLDVRGNVRYPDGGHWPEWVHANYGDHICTITLEYKKVYMDEWTGQVDLAKTDDLLSGLWRATAAAREELARCH